MAVSYFFRSLFTSWIGFILVFVSAAVILVSFSPMEFPDNEEAEINSVDQLSVVQVITGSDGRTSYRLLPSDLKIEIGVMHNRDDGSQGFAPLDLSHLQSTRYEPPFRFTALTVVSSICIGLAISFFVLFHSFRKQGEAFFWEKVSERKKSLDRVEQNFYQRERALNQRESDLNAEVAKRLKPLIEKAREKLEEEHNEMLYDAEETLHKAKRFEYELLERESKLEESEQRVSKRAMQVEARYQEVKTMSYRSLNAMGKAKRLARKHGSDMNYSIPKTT